VKNELALTFACFSLLNRLSCCTIKSLEHVVGQPLRDNQEVMIQIIDLDMVPDDKSRRQALARAAEIAHQGRTNAAIRGATAEEIDADIEEATREVRR